MKISLFIILSSFTFLVCPDSLFAQCGLPGTPPCPPSVNKTSVKPPSAKPKQPAKSNSPSQTNTKVAPASAAGNSRAESSAAQYQNYFNKGAYECQTEDCKIENLTKAINLQPRSDEAYYYRGMTYNSQKRYDEAIADFSRAIAINPHINNFWARAYLYFELHKFREAAADFSKVIEKEPNYYPYYLKRADAYRNLGDFDAAKADERLAEKTLLTEMKKAQSFLREGGILNDKAIRLQQPEYPAEARNKNIGGEVRVVVRISENGSPILTGTVAVSGNPLLRQAAENAANQSRFTPLTVDGKQYPFSGVIVYTFPR